MSSLSPVRARATTPASAAEAASTAAPQGFGATDAGLVLMATIWGVNYSVVKAGLQAMTPLSFTGVRMVFASVVLFGIASFVRAEWPNRRDIVRLLLLGLLGNGFYQLLFISGMARTRAGVAALIVAAGPAWIAILSRLLGRERVSRLGWAGIGLQLIGVLCVVGSTQKFDGGSDGLLGAVLIATGSIAWALYSILLQPYTQRSNGLHLSALTLASGAAMMGVIGIPDMLRLDWGAVGLTGWGAVAYSALLAMVVAYLLFYRGVRILGPTKTAMYGNLQPIIAIAVAWILLHETPTGWQLLGAACIMGGLLVSRTAKVRPAPEALEEAA
ncbi:DMT family transporter [Gemmatimonas sp.]|uniref:DMT family transporter n=1 Tax=Gemmatimonas sp. TaxID=1962908 RepID=UPI0022BADBB6|nr:DMT family transporter [Gemmatimonas sp.]MCZ8204141.1 DMT family transporter [Gemmatimonas sp.]